jgi:hypothetical protein
MGSAQHISLALAEARRAPPAPLGGGNPPPPSWKIQTSTP